MKTTVAATLAWTLMVSWAAAGSVGTRKEKQHYRRAMMEKAASEGKQQNEHWCGLSHQGIEKDLGKTAEVKKTQEYTSHKARGLGSSFVPIQEAYENGDTDSMRMNVTYEALYGQDPMQCMRVGQIVRLEDPDTGPEYTCELEDVVNPGLDDKENPTADELKIQLRFDVLRRRTQWATQLWKEAIQLKPVQGSIEIDEKIVENHKLNTTEYENSDLVVIVVARPAKQSIAGTATCLQRDQLNRCTVGRFRWVPSFINVPKRNTDAEIAAGRHIAAHELGHLLGAIIPVQSSGETMHLDKQGNCRDKNNITTVELDSDPASDFRGYPKEVTKVITHRVVKMAREQYACGEIDGLPLEDFSLGVGAHWEARLLGSEFMSYGSATGEVYISDLTLAYLEDTNQYIANYAKGGSLVESTVDDFSNADPDDLDKSTSDEYDPPPQLSPGYLRWGRWQGCLFARANARYWAHEYLCTKNAEHACTADNRMSAVCDIRQWTETDLSNELGSASLPSYYQYFDKSNGSKAIDGSVEVSRVGGFSMSLDFIPAPVGFRNCRYSAFASTNANEREGAQDVNIGNTDQMDLFGGQANCPECRCLRSTLVELNKIGQSTPTFGLCYRTNCYRPNYLQVGVKGALSGEVNWFRCARTGGKMFIPGYFGTLRCPDSRNFCQYETITGVKFLESNRYLELILWGIVGALTLLPLVILCFPCVQGPLIRYCKRKCGVNNFSKYDSQGNQLPSIYAIPSQCHQRVVLANSAFFMTLCFGILGFATWWMYKGRLNAHAMMPVMLACFWGVIISSLGLQSARETNPTRSCIILIYFFLQFFVTLLSLWASIALLVSDDLSVLVERNWDLICDAFEDRCTPTANEETQEKEMRDFTEYAETQMEIIGGLALLLVLFNSLSLFSSSRLIGGKTLTSTSLTVINNIGLILSLFLIAAGVYLTVVTELRADIGYVSGLFLAASVFMAINSPLGLYASHKKRISLLRLHIVITILYIILLLCATAVILGAESEVDKQIEGFNDNRLAEIADAMELSMTEEEMKALIKENVKRVGISAAVLSILQGALVFSTFMYIHYTRLQHDRWLEQEQKKRQERKNPSLVFDHDNEMLETVTT